MSVVSMKNVIAVRTWVVPKPSASAQIWKDIAKVISHSRTEVASCASNLVAESRTQEKTICASTIELSTDDLSMPAFWFPELGDSHCAKQDLLESYFKRQSSRPPLNFPTAHLSRTHYELPDYSTTYSWSHSSLSNLSDPDFIQCQQSHGTVTWRYACLSHEWRAEEDDQQYTLGSGRTERVHRSSCDPVEVFRKKLWTLSRTSRIDALCVDRDPMEEVKRQLAAAIRWILSDTPRVVWVFDAVKPDSMGYSQLACQLTHAPVDQPLDSDLINPILSWWNLGAYNKWMRCMEHVKSKFRTSAFSFVGMAPVSWGHEDEVTPNFRTPPANTSRSTIFSDFVSGHEDEVTPNFRTPSAHNSPNIVFWDFILGFRGAIVPTFRSRPLFHGLRALRLGIG